MSSPSLTISGSSIDCLGKFFPPQFGAIDNSLYTMATPICTRVVKCYRIILHQDALAAL